MHRFWDQRAFSPFTYGRFAVSETARGRVGVHTLAVSTLLARGTPLWTHTVQETSLTDVCI